MTKKARPIQLNWTMMSTVSLSWSSVVGRIYYVPNIQNPLFFMWSSLKCSFDDEWLQRSRALFYTGQIECSYSNQFHINNKNCVFSSYLFRIFPPAPVELLDFPLHRKHLLFIATTKFRFAVFLVNISAKLFEAVGLCFFLCSV